MYLEYVIGSYRKVFFKKQLKSLNNWNQQSSSCLLFPPPLVPAVQDVNSLPGWWPFHRASPPPDHASHLKWCWRLSQSGSQAFVTPGRPTGMPRQHWAGVTRGQEWTIRKEVSLQEDREWEIKGASMVNGRWFWEAAPCSSESPGQGQAPVALRNDLENSDLYGLPSCPHTSGALLLIPGITSQIKQEHPSPPSWITALSWRRGLCNWKSQFLGWLISPGSPRRREGSEALEEEIGVWNSQGRGKVTLVLVTENFFSFNPGADDYTTKQLSLNSVLRII